ncbi:MAG: hypothetical protein ABFS08_02980 [Pseudomonadota bacterium]
MATEEQVKNGALIAYIAYGIGMLIPIATLIGLIVNFVKRGDAQGTWVESHHRWMLRTVLFSVVWTIVALVVMFIPVVNLLLWPAMVVLYIWYIYRVVKGFLSLNNQKPMYEQLGQVATDTAGV